MAKTGNRFGIYSTANALNADIYTALHEMFPVTLPAAAAELAVVELSNDAVEEMKKELNKHRLTGETVDAVGKQWEWTRGGYGNKISSLVGIPRDGNVRNERPKNAHYRKGRGNWKNRTVKDSYGYLGDGAFYKGIYLEYGHGKLAPQKWFEKAINKTRKKINDEYMKALLAAWVDSE